MSEVKVVNGVEHHVKGGAPIAEARFNLSSVFRQDWVVNAEEGTTLEDIKQSGYWAHVAKQLTALDHIEVRAETMEWIAELVVIEQPTRNAARVFVKNYYDLTKIEKPAIAADAYRIEFKGPQRKHVVIRNSDNEPIQEGLPRKEDAMTWLRQHENIVG